MSAVEVVRTTRGRHAGAWIAIGSVLAAAAITGVLLSGADGWAARSMLDPDSHGPSGTRAVAQLLRDNGVDVVVTRDRGAAAEALARGDATLALPDAPALSDDALRKLVLPAADVVLLEPRSRTLRLLLPGSALAGAGSETPVAPACDLPEALRAGPVAPGSVFEPGGDARLTACYETDDGWGLLVLPDGEHRRVAVDADVLFTNDVLAEHGNAALALSLLGRHPTVVWYVPSLADSDLAAGDASLGDLTPRWVGPVIALLLSTGVAAGVWRGRRFGPLVAERLPVTVRSSETTEGRARLYARSRDAAHAADQLRIGALRRIARMLGLGPAATATEIADAAAARTGWERTAVRGILLYDLPRGDAQLVSLHERLRALEDAVGGAVRPATGSGLDGRGRPAGAPTPTGPAAPSGPPGPTDSRTGRNPT